MINLKFFLLVILALLFTFASGYWLNRSEQIRQVPESKNQETPIPTLTPLSKNPSITSYSTITPHSRIVEDGCVVSGCNGEMCSNEPLNSICIYKPEYECYKNATCAKIDGKCGWIMTSELKNCLNRSI